MKISDVKRFTLAVNTVILALVFGLMGFFYLCGATFMTYFSLPTAAVYIIGYVLIVRDKLPAYVWTVFSWLTFYMGAATVCLGYGYGFHLYCFSMIPVIFVTEYISYRLGSTSEKPVFVSLVAAAVYLVSTGYAAFFGPVYDVDGKMLEVFWISNSAIVFGFLIYYCNYLLRSVVEAEEKLKEAAHLDRLTGLYNRRYALDLLESLPEEEAPLVAMADVDDFKRVNDVYGHNAGDEALRSVAAAMKEICSGGEISRWGGEEFLLLFRNGEAEALETLERLRSAVEARTITYGETSFRITLTIGAAKRRAGVSVDEWVNEVDERLYRGKRSGKNRIVYD